MANEKKLPEHVQIIQSLMLRPEKGRAVLVPSFLLTGLISLLTGVALTVKTGLKAELGSYPLTAGFWVSSWLTVALSVLLLSFFFIAKLAKKDGHQVNSPQLRHVFRSALPALLLGFTFGTALAFHNADLLPVSAAIWIASYGVALHNIRLYATKSVRILSALMLALGLAALVISLKTQGLIHPTHLANFFMCQAFGMFHLITAAGSILFTKMER